MAICTWFSTHKLMHELSNLFTWVFLIMLRGVSFYPFFQFGWMVLVAVAIHFTKFTERENLRFLMRTAVCYIYVYGTRLEKKYIIFIHI